MIIFLYFSIIFTLNYFWNLLFSWSGSLPSPCGRSLLLSFPPVGRSPEVRGEERTRNGDRRTPKVTSGRPSSRPFPSHGSASRSLRSYRLRLRNGNGKRRHEGLTKGPSTWRERWATRRTHCHTGLIVLRLRLGPVRLRSTPFGREHEEETSETRTDEEWDRKQREAGS